MFSKQDLISYSQMLISDAAKGSLLPFDDQFEKWVDSNPRYVLTEDTRLKQYDNVNPSKSETAPRLLFPKGTELRQYGCPVPSNPEIVCDVIGSDSPEVRLYLVPLASTIRKDD